jgi:hypothetical protein
MNDTRSLEVTWHGPFHWCTDFLQQPIALKSGIYLWTIPYQDNYLIYYIGETERPFMSRMSEHLQNYYVGEYQIFRSKKFLKGHKDRVWSGIWYSPRSERKNILDEFKDTYHQYASIMQSFICTMHLFLGPLDVTKRILQRVEARARA